MALLSTSSRKGNAIFEQTILKTFCSGLLETFDNHRIQPQNRRADQNGTVVQYSHYQDVVFSKP